MSLELTGRPGDCTVVVVSYRHAPYVDACLDSLLGQERVARVVLIDDGSPDDTVARVRDWNERHGGVVEVHADGDNRGVCARLEQALATVETAYYSYISTDDTMEPGRIRRLTDLLDDLGSSHACAYSDSYLCGPDGERWPHTFADRFPPPPVASGEVFPSLLRDNWIATPTVLMRTGAVRAAGGYDATMPYEDYELWLRLSRVGRFAHLDECLATVRINDSGVNLTAAVMSDPDEFNAILARMLVRQVGVSPEFDRIIMERLRPKLRSIAAGARTTPSPGLARGLAELGRRTRTPQAVAAAALVAVRGRRAS